MKKLFFALLGLLILSTSNSIAQISFGAKAGVNLTNMEIKEHGEKNDDTKTKLGFNIGAFADMSFTDLLGLEVGLNLESKGYKESYEEEFWGEKLEIKNTFNILYITVPVDIRLNFNDFYVLAGPYFGIAASGKVTSKCDGEKESNDIEFGDDGVSRMDVGLGVGVGYKFTENLGARVGYDMGLSNICNAEHYEMKNSSINISVTYNF